MRTLQLTSRQASHYSITNAQDEGLTCCSAETYDCTMKWTACCTGFFGFLCCAKVMLSDETHFDSSLHLYLEDIRLVTFCFSGILTFATRDPQLTSCGPTVCLGDTGSALCPVVFIYMLGARCQLLYWCGHNSHCCGCPRNNNKDPLQVWHTRGTFACRQRSSLR